MKALLLMCIGLLGVATQLHAQGKEECYILFDKKVGENPSSTNPGEFKADGTFFCLPGFHYEKIELIYRPVGTEVWTVKSVDSPDKKKPINWTCTVTDVKPGEYEVQVRLITIPAVRKEPSQRCEAVTPDTRKITVKGK